MSTSPQSQEVGPTNAVHNIHHTKDGDTRPQCNAIQESGFQVSELVLVIRDLYIDIRECVFRSPSPYEWRSVIAMVNQ